MTSQIFSNVYLDKLDWFVKRTLREQYYFRYADDFLVLGTSARHLQALIGRIQAFLAARLRLTLHPKKTEIRKLSQGIDFLGYVLLPHHKALRTRTKRRMFRRVSSEKKGLESGLITEDRFISSLQSYLGMLKHCNGHKIRRGLLELAGVDEIKNFR